MFLPLLLLLLPLSDAFVRMQNSILYDEEDFRGVPQITTDMCAAGCKVYATIAITDDNTRITKNILVHNPNMNEDTSIADISKRVMRNTLQKAYVEMGNVAIVTISNKNANLESAPLALWIVSTRSPYYLEAEVYEPVNLNRKSAIVSAPITILSAYPFTAILNAGEASIMLYFTNSNSILARTVGYDAIDRKNADNCYAAMDYDFGSSFFGATFSINGPLLTISFDTAKYPHSQVDLTASNVYNFDRFPAWNQPVFISSPGFVCGSASSSQVYRSSALQKNNDYTFKTPNNKEMVFSFDVDVVSDENHPVKIFDTKTQTDSKVFFGNFKDKTNSVQATMQTNLVTVSFTPGAGDSFFGMRVTVDDVDKTATTSVFDATTSSSSIHRLAVLLLAVVVLIIA